MARCRLRTAYQPGVRRGQHDRIIQQNLTTHPGQAAHQDRSTRPCQTGYRCRRRAGYHRRHRAGYHCRHLALPPHSKNTRKVVVVGFAAVSVVAVGVSAKTCRIVRCMFQARTCGTKSMEAGAVRPYTYRSTKVTGACLVIVSRQENEQSRILIAADRSRSILTVCCASRASVLLAISALFRSCMLCSARKAGSIGESPGIVVVIVDQADVQVYQSRYQRRTTISTARSGELVHVRRRLVFGTVARRVSPGSVPTAGKARPGNKTGGTRPASNVVNC